MAQRSSGERVVLVDGTALIYRAFFALPPHLTTKAGLHTNAIFGFASMFKKLFAQKRPRFGAVVFDPPGPTTRDLVYPEYKAQRDPMADDLREQLPHIDRVVQAYQFPLLRVPGLEADDVIGTLCQQAVDAGHDVVIVSSDKDFAQLIGDQVRMQDTLRDVTYDRELVKKKWGVTPEQIADLLALMGDSADNIPGVDGIGQKGAVDLLTEHGSLDAIYATYEADVERFKGRAKKALGAGKANALLSRTLATIDRQATLPMSLVDLSIGEPVTAELNALYKELEFYSLLSRDESVQARQADAAAGPVRICSTPEDVHTAVAALAEPVALLLLHDGRAVSGEPVVLALCGAVGEPVVVPIDDARLRALVPLLQDERRKKTAYDAKACMVQLSRRGITLRGVDMDVRLASFLVDPNRLINEHHNLHALAKMFLQRTLPQLKDITGSGKEEQALAALPIDAVAGYAAELVTAVRDLRAPLAAELDTRGQAGVQQDVDLPLSRVLAGMELAGICVDSAELKAIGDELAGRRSAIEATVVGLAGRSFNLGSPKQLGEVLFDELKLPVLKRTKSGYSTDADVLERLADEHPIARELLEYRRLDKLINTYTDVLQREVSPLTGRIHATFQQTVGVTGRLITMDPDLQRTPIRTAEGQRIREAFVAEQRPGRTPMVIVDADWSQIELRLLAHFSEDPLLVSSFKEHADVHRRTAAQIFHKRENEVTPSERTMGKTVNFSTIYGQGASALARILSIPPKEAQQLIDAYFVSYAGVRAFLDRCIVDADTHGYASTLLGRRRIIPELASKGSADRSFGERVAQNTPIQGSAADICKLAMLRIAKRLPVEAPHTRMILQVHDELLFEAPEDEASAVAALVKHEMEHVVELRVPLIAEVGVGKSWGHAH